MIEELKPCPFCGEVPNGPEAIKQADDSYIDMI